MEVKEIGKQGSINMPKLDLELGQECVRKSVWPRETQSSPQDQAFPSWIWVAGSRMCWFRISQLCLWSMLLFILGLPSFLLILLIVQQLDSLCCKVNTLLDSRSPKVYESQEGPDIAKLTSN